MSQVTDAAAGERALMASGSSFHADSGGARDPREQEEREVERNREIGRAKVGEARGLIVELRGGIGACPEGARVRISGEIDQIEKRVNQLATALEITSRPSHQKTYVRELDGRIARLHELNEEISTQCSPGSPP